MNVAELIKFLQQQPQDALVAYRIYSEQALVTVDRIKTVELCVPREDGWIEYKRPDKAAQTYVLFPGN